METKNNDATTTSVLLIGLEFVEPLFSGNGIMTHSVVRGLLHVGYTVHVLCARPDDTEHRTNASFHSAIDEKRLHVTSVPVPAESWRKLDRTSSWQELAQYAPDAIRGNNDDRSSQSFSDVRFVFSVDWSAIPTYNSLQRHDLLLNDNTCDLIHLVFRVFSRSQELLTSLADSQFYQDYEGAAIAQAKATFVLSHVDQQELVKLNQQHHPSLDKLPRFHILCPPLRQDVLQLTTHQSNDGVTNHNSQTRRKYIACNVRLSPEKNAIFFAQLMRSLSNSGALARLDVIPLMIGNVCDEEYAKRVLATLPPETLTISTFIEPELLLSYLKNTLLLLHPPVYDAYGMIIAEAAAVGTPSLIHKSSCVGASSLFREEEEEILCGDMSCISAASERLLCLLEQKEYLGRVGSNAKDRALGWTTVEYAKEMDLVLRQLSADDNNHE